jgi:hypothetical protein
MKYFKILFPVVAISSFSVLATDSHLATETFDIVSSNGSLNFFETTDASQSPTSITIDGVVVNVGMTAWSDTGAQSAAYKVNGKYYVSTLDGDTAWEDETVQSANIEQWGSGIAIANADSTGLGKFDINGNGIKTSLEGDSHSIDNISDYGNLDFDMVLLSFSESVTLTGASVSWLTGSNGSNEITVAGLSENSVALFDGTSTWTDIAENTIAGAVGHFGISSSSYESNFTGLASAQYWLVGAYNTFFDDNAGSFNGVGFKLSSLGIELADATAPPPAPTPVSEPGALALMSIGLGLLAYRRKRRV